MKLGYLKLWMVINIILTFVIGHAWLEGYIHNIGGFLPTALVFISIIVNIAKWPHIHWHHGPVYDEYDYLNWEGIKGRTTLLLEIADFETLDVESERFWGQYVNPYRHPVAAHLVRKGMTDIRISPYTIEHLVDNWSEAISVDAGENDIIRAANALKKGEKYGVIVINNNKYSI